MTKAPKLESSPSVANAVSRMRGFPKKTCTLDFNQMEADPNRIRLTTKRFLKKKVKEFKELVEQIEQLKPEISSLNSKLSAIDMKAKFTWEVVKTLEVLKNRENVISEFSLFNTSDIKSITEKYDESIRSNLTLHLNRWRISIAQTECMIDFENQKQSEIEARKSLMEKKKLLEQKRRDLEDIKLIEEQTQQLQQLSFSEARVEIFKLLNCSLPEQKNSRNPISDTSSVSSSDSPPFLSDEDDEEFFMPLACK